MTFRQWERRNENSNFLCHLLLESATRLVLDRTELVILYGVWANILVMMASTQQLLVGMQLVVHSDTLQIMTHQLCL